MDNHSPDPVSLNCTLQVHAWRSHNLLLNNGAPALFEKHVKLPSLESAVWLNTTFDDLVGLDEAGLNCSLSSCFFEATCSGVSTGPNTLTATIIGNSNCLIRFIVHRIHDCFE